MTAPAANADTAQGAKPRLAIIGDENISGEPVTTAIAAAVNSHRPEYIITAGRCEGVSEEATEWAHEQRIPLDFDWPNLFQAGRAA